jgi:hypothetical protein
MEDFIDELFSAADEYYPGSKRKRRDTEKKTRSDLEIKSWDSRPYVKPLPNGKDIELFTLGALAEALGRPIITVRHWTKEGYIPQAPYRLPAKEDKNGTLRKGRRLYSRAMIEAAVEIFDKNGLLDLIRVEWSNHQRVVLDISEAWDKLRATDNEHN